MLCDLCILVGATGDDETDPNRVPIGCQLGANLVVGASRDDEFMWYFYVFVWLFSLILVALTKKFT